MSPPNIIAHHNTTKPKAHRVLSTPTEWSSMAFGHGLPYNTRDSTPPQIVPGTIFHADFLHGGEGGCSRRRRRTWKDLDQIFLPGPPFRRENPAVKFIHPRCVSSCVLYGALLSQLLVGTRGTIEVAHFARIFSERRGSLSQKSSEFHSCLKIYIYFVCPGHGIVRQPLHL